jgi:RHS repeat-associated protein
MLSGLGLDDVFIRSDSAGTKTLLADSLGSTIAVADASGNVQTEYTYDPFGKPSASGAAINNTAQFTGRDNDGTGLYYYRARYYSPTLQRFISEDPMGLAGGNNLYAYVGNNPVNITDSSGMIWDTLADIGFMGYDLYRLFKDGRKDLGTNLAALGLDAGGALIPFATGLGMIKRAERAAELANRANEVHRALDPIAQSRRTTAAVRAVAPDGTEVIIIASSERSLSRAQQAALQAGEVAARGEGHAEVTAINAAREMGLRPVEVAASRPICTACAQATYNAGAATVTRLK